jgi:demethylmenaquinone methyltransferase/2-methoxy-6-polyprenyl-1,4-benzoquinol methylase
LSEAWRVLGSGGELLSLDFTEPTLPGFKQVYRFYFRFILPFVGGIVSGQRKAYSYLPQSVGNFPQGAAFLELMADAGFEMTRAMRLTLGICAVYQGCKPQGNVLSDK